MNCWYSSYQQEFEIDYHRNFAVELQSKNELDIKALAAFQKSLDSG